MKLPQGTRRAGPALEGVQVLVVDDERDTRKLLRITLERDGCVVEEATNGAEALACANGRPFDVILLDVMMPGMSGYDVCRCLRESPSTCDIPVIFLSARGQRDDAEQGLELGAAAYVVKPFSTYELTAEIERVVATKASGGSDITQVQG